MFGTVEWFNDAKGYGWIVVDGRTDKIFVHYTAIKGDGYKTLNEGDRVSLDLIDGPKRPQATNVCRILSNNA